MSASVTGPGPSRGDVSGAVTGVILRYVQARAGDGAVARVLADAGEDRPASVLLDPGSWSTQEAAVSLLEAAARVTGDSEIGRHAGRELLRQYEGTESGDQLRALGTPGALLGTVAAAASRFMTAAPLEVELVTEGRAVVRATTRPGEARHVALCALTRGLLSEVPGVFGLAPAVVTETECQALGGRSCCYQLAWDERPAAAGGSGGEHMAILRARLLRMADRLEELASSASDLVSGDDLASLLAAVTARAARAVRAPATVLAVSSPPDGEVAVHCEGLGEEEARAAAADILADPTDAGGTRLVVDVASARRRYGRLAALFPAGTGFMEQEREVFSLYATYAAAALDLATATADAERSDATARSVLDLAGTLSRATTAAEVRRALADAVPGLVGSQRSAVLGWDAGGVGLLPAPLDAEEPDPDAVAAVVGDPAVAAAEGSAVAGDLMAGRQPVVVGPHTDDRLARDHLERSQAVWSILAPLVSGGEFVGVVTADFDDAPEEGGGPTPDQVARLAAVADLGATALLNARLREQVGRLGWYDSLTGLPNRRLLEERAAKELERAAKAELRTAVFFVDLDRFKRVNDNCGHAAGDELLRHVALRLRDVVRRQDTVARLAGDEFAVLLPGLANPTAIEQLAGRMLERLRRPFEVLGTEVATSASIGIAIFPDHGTSFDELLSHADEAMYRSKGMGRDTFSVYEPAVEKGGRGEEVHEADLRQALAAHQLFLLYQPYVDLRSGQVVGVEALVRWRHPTRGVLEASAFVPGAERTGVIVDIDRFVVEEAVAQLRAWSDQGLAPLRMSVNVSRRDLMDPGFVDTVRSALHRHDVAPARLEIEVSGRLLVDAAGPVHQTIEALRREGVRFTVDDFGSGSSPEQVATFPVNTIKVSRSFLQLLGPPEEVRLLTTAVIAMADRLGMECVVGGRDPSHQSPVLLQRGATTAGGFYFSPPLEAADVHLMVEGMATGVGRPELTAR